MPGGMALVVAEKSVAFCCCEDVCARGWHVKVVVVTMRLEEMVVTRDRRQRKG